MTTLTASAQWICTCGWAMSRIPLPVPDSEEVRPARWQLICRNRQCEHHGRRWQQPSFGRRVELREAAHD